MEWSWRTVMILLGLVAMVAILIDGFRRMRRARAEALRLDVSHDFKFPEDDYNPELPGEVRVVGGLSDAGKEEQTSATNDIPAFSALYEEDALDNDPQFSMAEDMGGTKTTESEVQHQADAAKMAEGVLDEQSPETEHKQAISEAPAVDLGQPDSPLTPQVKPVNLDEQVPVLLDVEELGEDTEAVCQSDQSVSENDCPLMESSADDHEQNEQQDSVALDIPGHSEHQGLIVEPEDPEHIHDPHLELEADPEEVAEALADTAQMISQPVNFAGNEAEILAHRPTAEVVLVIHAIAQSEQGFKGGDLIYLFNSCDLRYGEKNIFHRFEEADGAGCIQFSVSQSHEPGIFEPSNMAEQHYRGLSFFMSLPGAKRPLEAYEAMYEMAMVVSRNLSADLFDESLSALTPQTVEANREDIMTFERHQHLMLKKQSIR